MQTVAQTAVAVVPTARPRPDLEEESALAARRARQWAQSWAQVHCRRYDPDGPFEAALVLVVGELAANAVRHGGGLRNSPEIYTSGPDEVYAVVQDFDPHHVPVPTQTAQSLDEFEEPEGFDKDQIDLETLEALLSNHGRGYRLIDRSVTDWGVWSYPRRGYKEVWARFAEIKTPIEGGIFK